MRASVPNLADALWRKSSRSGGQGQCVEIAHLSATTAVRDSKNPAGPVLAFAPDVFGAFLKTAKRDQLNT